MNIKQFRWTLGQHPLAYMSAEFALDERLPMYSGGLGVLAGDIVREANDMHLPFVGVSLLYREGFMQQQVSPQGVQHAQYKKIDVKRAPISLIVNREQTPVRISVPLGTAQVALQLWEYREGDVSVLLLDADCDSNSAALRSITKRLYDTNGDVRLQQEVLLGIGGVRALMELGIHPSIYHLNDSHSAFAIFEIVHHYMQEYGMSFHEAYRYAHTKIIFTNHTLIAAGNEQFLLKTVEQLLAPYLRMLGVTIGEALQSGVIKEFPHLFSLSQFALSLSCRANAVSKLHARKARELWPDHELIPITNGIHLPTWVHADIKAQAPQWNSDALQTLLPDQLWLLHTNAKRRLIDLVHAHTGKQFKLEHLIVTWARRIVAYKRPTALFEDMQQLTGLVGDTSRPLQIIIAGKAHPSDHEGQESIQQIIYSIQRAGLDERIVFIENYSLTLALFMVSGSDVWLNTPMRGQEASGTSGMKSGANGVLQCSVRDGWIDEVPLDEIGWSIPTQELEQAVYQILREQVAPLYYERNTDGLPLEWIKKMKQTMEVVWSKYSSRRMLNEYIELLYRPTVELEEREKHAHDWRRNYGTKY